MSLDTGERDTGELATDDYYAAGEAAALDMDNRGPIRFTDDGSLHPDILEAYWAHGFYVFENVVDAAELAELRSDIDQLLERAPYPTKRSTTDRHGRPALGLDFEINPWLMTKPLSDPWGGKPVLNGRHQVKMHEPTPAEDAPLPTCRFSSAAASKSVRRSCVSTGIQICCGWPKPSMVPTSRPSTRSCL